MPLKDRGLQRGDLEEVALATPELERYTEARREEASDEHRMEAGEEEDGPALLYGRKQSAKITLMSGCAKIPVTEKEIQGPSHEDRWRRKER